MNFITTSFLFISIMNINFSNSQDFEKKLNNEITIYELVCNAKAFDSKKIVLNGYFDKNGYLFFSKDDFKYAIYKNSFKLDTSGIVPELLDKFNGKYIQLSGTYYYSHINRFSGFMSRISLLLDYEELLMLRIKDEKIRNKN